MITSTSRGHEIYYNNELGQWFYCDNNKKLDENRPCKKCGKLPTKQGHDACLGEIKDVISACCGHGLENIIIMDKS